MAYNFRQQSRTRKFVYLGIIFALFTVSLLHRRFIIEPEANYLELREVARGEAELGGAALRLVLTGSSGLATTFLWSYALDLQETHQFNELKLVVESITKLQPHFSTPWIFQSWNLSFNVAVEFDAPRDKYFYISEGLNLLARGERANQGRQDLEVTATHGKVQRGNPDMRWFLGFTYQSKIGNSDENTTMRCLLDLSCINPSERDPKRLLDPSRPDQVNVTEFENFCKANPRLVRRLFDGLDHREPIQIVRFLENNSEVPSRFVFDTKKQKYEIKDWKDQFPVLPLPFATGVATHRGVPNPRDEKLILHEAIDVFLMSRTWYEYAQLPLPPPTKDPSMEREAVDELVHRVPKRGWLIIFRQYPPRSQFYIAENLQKEGWFDGEGWEIGRWLADKGLRPQGTRLRVGENDPRYHSGYAWDQAYEFYKDFGERNGLYLSASARKELEAKAQVFEKRFNIMPGGMVNRPPNVDDPAVLEGFEAHNKLANRLALITTINFEEFLNQADAERYSDTILARKLIAEAKSLRLVSPTIAKTKYEQALALWRDVFVRYREYGKLIPVQEDVYEVQFDYLNLVQKDRFRPLTNALGALADLPLPTPPLWQERILHQLARDDRNLTVKVAAAVAAPLAGPFEALGRGLGNVSGAEPAVAGVPIAQTLFSQAGDGTIYFRTARGPLETVQVYEGKDAQVYTSSLMLAQGLAMPMPLFVPTQPALIDPEILLYRSMPIGSEYPEGWRPLLFETAIHGYRMRRELPELN